MKIGKFGGRLLFQSSSCSEPCGSSTKAQILGQGNQFKGIPKRSLDDGLFFVDAVKWTTIH